MEHSCLSGGGFRRAPAGSPWNRRPRGSCHVCTFRPNPEVSDAHSVQRCVPVQTRQVGVATAVAAPWLGGMILLLAVVSLDPAACPAPGLCSRPDVRECRGGRIALQRRSDIGAAWTMFLDGEW